MDKPHLLLLHGALGAAKEFDKLQEMLQPHFNVHVLDFRGHGKKASQNNSFGIEAFTCDVHEYLQKNELHGINTFGYSMGGYVALWLAHNHPKLVQKVFTLATKFNWTPDSSAAEAKMLNPDIVKEKVPQFAQYLHQLHGKQWPDLMQKTADMMISLGNRPIVDDEVLQKLEIPVRVSLGDRDQMVSPAETIKAYRMLKNGQLQVFPNTLHPLHKVALQPLQQAIISFFSH